MKNETHLALKSRSNVLILGPSGTGKSRLAQMIHDQGVKKGRPFVKANLACLHEGTFESTLFGHERGAFTGALEKKRGLLELAHGGTLFLDEISEVPLSIQGRLLEFLQSREVTPIGGHQPKKVDVRVIAASHQPIQQWIREKKFREDLYHRLNVIQIHLPPLMDRREDFDSLFHDSLNEIAQRNRKSIKRIHPSLAKTLEDYPWPGNIRELRNVIEYLVIAAEGPELQVCHLPVWFKEVTKSGAVRKKGELGELLLPLSSNYEEMMHFFEEEFIARALTQKKWKINETARWIGMNKTTLIRRIREFQLKPEFKGEEEIDDIGGVSANA